MEAKVAALSLPAALQRASGSNEGLGSVALGWKPSLCHWWIQGGGIELAIRGQYQSSIKPRVTEEVQGIQEYAQTRLASEALWRPTLQPTYVRPSG